MSLKQGSSVEETEGNEGTRVGQYFHPNNTQRGIRYSLARFSLESGKRTKLHKMRSSEIYYILEGTGILRVEGKTFRLDKDDSAYVPPNAKQSIKNDGKTTLRFLCIVEPAWKPDDETVLE